MRQYTLPLLSMQAPRRSKQQQQQKLVAKVSISILVMALPVLYVSFLHVPPAALFRDTTFWFLMSNSIIIVIAADSGMLFFASPAAACDDDVPLVFSGEELPLPVVIRNQELGVAENNHALVVKGGGGDAIAAPESGEPSTMLFSSSAFASAAAGEAVAVKNVDGAIVEARPARLTASKSLAKEERARRRRSRSHSHALQMAVPVQDKSVVVREEKLRRTATEPRPEESEYERLSDEELNRRVEEFITRFNREIRLQLEKEQA